jgi:hypothetical protein
LGGSSVCFGSIKTLCFGEQPKQTVSKQTEKTEESEKTEKTEKIRKKRKKIEKTGKTLHFL